MFMYSIPIIMRKYNNLNLFSENLEIKKYERTKTKKENKRKIVKYFINLNMREK